MPRPLWGLWLTTLIWIGVCGGLWARHDYQLRHGREISLKTVPVDPRDVLRGDYVTLRYEISTFAGDERGSPQTYLQERVVYAQLEERDGDWHVRSVDLEPPDEGLFLRARAGRVRDDRLPLTYGIESFFVPEGEGREYEQARNRRRLWAVVSVSPHGVTHLKRLEIRD